MCLGEQPSGFDHLSYRLNILKTKNLDFWLKSKLIFGCPQTRRFRLQICLILWSMCSVAFPFLAKGFPLSITRTSITSSTFPQTRLGLHNFIFTSSSNVFNIARFFCLSQDRICILTSWVSPSWASLLVMECKTSSLLPFSEPKVFIDRKDIALLCLDIRQLT